MSSQEKALLTKELDTLEDKKAIEGFIDDVETMGGHEDVVELAKKKIEALEGKTKDITPPVETSPNQTEQVKNLGGSNEVVAERVAPVDEQIAKKDEEIKTVTHDAEQKIEEVQNNAESKVEEIKSENPEQNPEQQKKQEALNKMFTQIEDAKNKKEEEQKGIDERQIEKIFKDGGGEYKNMESLDKGTKEKIMNSLLDRFGTDPAFFSERHPELLKQLNRDQMAKLLQKPEFLLSVDPDTMREILNKASVDFNDKSYNQVVKMSDGSGMLEDVRKSTVKMAKDFGSNDPKFSAAMFAFKTADISSLEAKNKSGAYMKLNKDIDPSFKIAEFKQKFSSIVEEKGLLGLDKMVERSNLYGRPEFAGKNLANIMKSEFFQMNVLQGKSLFESLKNSKTGIKEYLAAQDGGSAKNLLGAYSEMKRVGLLTEDQVKELITL